MVGWYYGCNGYEFEQIPGDIEGQGSLESCSPWGLKELDTSLQLNNSNNKINKQQEYIHYREYNQ